MQRRLFEATTNVENYTSTNQHIYYCVNCVLDLNSPDANKFQTRIIRRQVRVVLEPIPGTNLLICPRCRSQQLKPDFFKGSKHYKRL